MFKLRTALWVSGAFVAAVCVFVLIVFYPQAYYFNDKIEYKNFKVYYDKKIPDQIYEILDTVDLLIQKSDFYDSKVNFKIFLRSDVDKYNALPFQFPAGCAAWVIPGIKNVFVYKSDCATNTSYNYLGHTRSLSTVLAHELIHVLVENGYFFKSKRAYFDKDSLSQLGVLWKEEGYAEYIAGGSSIEIEEGLKILNNEALPHYAPHLEYFKCWLTVRYLILEKHMSFEEILDAKLKLDDVLSEARLLENTRALEINYHS